MIFPGQFHKAFGRRYIWGKTCANFYYIGLFRCVYMLRYCCMNDVIQFWNDLGPNFGEVDFAKFGFNLVVTAVMSSLLALFYVRFGNAIGNRRRFARVFMPLALTTMLIIVIVRSSLTLSLGLVGALSIVRFRSAIKDPEELVYLFLTIGLGLAAGADEVAIAAISFVSILGLLFLQKLASGKRAFATSNNMHLNVSTSKKDLQGISDILSQNFPFVELKRVDESADRLDVSFLVSAGSVQQIESARTALAALSADTVLSFVEQRNLPV